MRPFGPTGLATLSAREVGDLIVYLRDMGRVPHPRPGIRRVQGNVAAGAALFAQMCAGCHGDDGVGNTGPALHDDGLLAAASDGYLQAIIARGRPGTAMKPFTGDGIGLVVLAPKEINDIVSYIRSWQSAGGN